jgi:hypothetical protein
VPAASAGRVSVIAAGGSGLGVRATAWDQAPKE